jgi:hypothetical protein
VSAEVHIDQAAVKKGRYIVMLKHAYLVGPLFLTALLGWSGSPHAGPAKKGKKEDKADKPEKAPAPTEKGTATAASTPAAPHEVASAPAAATPAATTPAVALAHKRSSFGVDRPQLRAQEVKTARGAEGSIQLRTSGSSSKNEEAVAANFTPPSATIKLAPTKPALVDTPYQRALSRVQTTVAQRHPGANGKVMVSFRVNRSGGLEEVFVAGFDATLDAALEKQLSGETLPDKAGQKVMTTLIFRGGKASVR